MKNVAILIDDVYSYAGTENVCNFMTDSIGDKCDVTIISLRGEGETFYPFRKVKKIISLQNKKFKYLFLRNVIKYYDQIFVVSMGRLSVFFYFFSIAFNNNKANLIACEHISFESFPWWLKLLKVHAYKKYNKVVVLTEHDKRLLEIKKVSTLRIPNSINYHNFVKKSTNHRILAVGRLEEQKNFTELLHIWADFIIKNPGYKLSIAGEGKQRSELQKIIKEKKLTECVHLLGKVNNIDSLYKEHDFLVMTSLYEGLPLALLEAKSWSLPVIAYNCPTGPKDIIKNNLDGFLIPNGNKKVFLEKMDLLSNNEDIVLNMASNTVMTHLEFDANEIARKWVNLLF